MHVFEETYPAANPGGDASGPNREAPQASRTPWVRLAFSFPVMLAFALAVLVSWTARTRFNDPDTWWHLKVGESIWNSRSLPQYDQYSYTTNAHPWIAHEWLAEVSLYAAYKAGGYRLLWWWLAGFGSLLCVLLYALCSLHSGNAKVSLLGGMTGWFFGTVSLALRPLLLGHVFLISELILLDLARRKDRRWLWGLPPLFAVWVNCHGSHVFGLAVLGVFLFCSFVEFRAGLLVSRRWDPQARRLLCAIFPLSLAALFANPIGWRLVTYPLNLFTKQKDNLQNISEWRPLDFQEPWGMGLFALALICALIVLVRRTELHFDEMILALLGAWMAVRHTRLVFVFGILVAPVVCRLLADLWERWDPKHDHPVANGVLIFAAIAIIVFTSPSVAQLQKQVDKDNPVGAVDFIRRTGLSGPMMNEYAWGGYLIWALPEHKVFVDGRTDIFDWTGVFMAYGRWSNFYEDPQKLLDKYGIRFCLLRKESGMAWVMPYLPGWKKVYSDELAVIFART